jgi:hypothetical protein
VAPDHPLLGAAVLAAIERAATAHGPPRGLSDQGSLTC